MTSADLFRIPRKDVGRAAIHTQLGIRAAIVKNGYRDELNLANVWAFAPNSAVLRTRKVQSDWRIDEDAKMQNVDEGSEPQTPPEPTSQSPKSTPKSNSSSPHKYSETEYYFKNRRFMSDSSEGEDDSVCEVGPAIFDTHTPEMVA